MSKAQHTPGPWGSGRLPARIGDGFGYGGESTVILGDGLVITLESGRDQDARLIAAAPELLEACQEFEAIFADSDMRPEDECRALHSKMRAAIAKATGQ